MEIYLPTLEDSIRSLVVGFRILVFVIMVAGFVVAVNGERSSGSDLLRLLLRTGVIVALLATMDLWFPRTERIFLSVANVIDPGFNDHPTSAANQIREGTAKNPEGQNWSWRRINESIYQAVTQSMANVFIYVGTLITVPMLILQYILRWLMYLIAPFALAMFMVPGFGSIGVRFFQQLLAILAWPVGFALTNLVALSVWEDFRGAVAPVPTSASDVLYSPLLTFMGGIQATIVIVVGMISTPVVMQMLFAQGQAFSGASANPLAIFRTTAAAMRAARAGQGSAPSAAPASRPSKPVHTISRFGI